MLRVFDASSRLVLQFAALDRWGQTLNIIILRRIAVEKAGNCEDGWRVDSRCWLAVVWQAAFAKLLASQRSQRGFFNWREVDWDALQAATRDLILTRSRPAYLWRSCRQLKAEQCG